MFAIIGDLLLINCLYRPVFNVGKWVFALSSNVFDLHLAFIVYHRLASLT